MSSVVYKPTADWIQKSHLSRLIQKLNFKSEAELLHFSQTQTEEFWTQVLEDIDLKFSKPPQKVLSEGLPFPKWAVGGELSLVENCIDRHLATNAQKTALYFEDDEGKTSASWTFEDLARESSFVAQILLDSGAKKGDRAALLMPMSLEMAAAFFGVLRAGLTVIPIFSGYGEDAIASRLEDSAAQFVFLQTKTTRRGKEIPVRATLDPALKNSPSVRKVFSLDRVEFLRGHQNQKIIPSVQFGSEDECLLLYTSGTTGKPKACVHTSFGVLATTGKEHRYAFDVHSSDRFFWYTDIGWMMGPWELFGALQFGASVVLYEGVPDYPTAGRLWEIIERLQITHFGISPTAVRVLKKAGDEFLNEHSRKSLRILGSTGEPWDEESWLWFFNKVGEKRCPILNISGGTEIMGCLLMPSPLSELKPCSLGGPALGVNAKAFSENAEPLSSGLGHLVCLSPLPSMTKGFLGSQERYLKTYFEKFGEKVWYHGDWALIDEDGFWFLKGRSDDTIKIAGKRVGPNEFESALMEHSNTAEVAAVGIPHELKGEVVHCFVVQKKPAPEPEELRKALMLLATKKMGKALSPEKIWFVEALPKTRSGKILRSTIRKIFLKEVIDESAVDFLPSIQSVREAW